MPLAEHLTVRQEARDKSSQLTNPLRRRSPRSQQPGAGVPQGIPCGTSADYRPGLRQNVDGAGSCSGTASRSECQLESLMRGDEPEPLVEAMRVGS